MGPAAVLAIWALTRGVVAARRLKFDGSDLDSAWQFLDLPELRDHLARSLWYLHAQPPGFNFLIGLSLKLSSEPVAAFFHPLFLLTGAVLHVAIYGMLRVLGIGRVLSVLGAAFFALTPSSILYENWLYYSYPATAVLVLSSVALGIAAREPRNAYAWHIFFGLTGILVLSVAQFHLLWLLLVVLFVALMDGRRGLVLRAALPWILLVVALYAKNAVLFGSFSGSSWFGMNLARVAELAVPKPVLAAGVRSGRLSPVASTPPFADPSAYSGFASQSLALDRGIPVLERETRSNGAVNYNNGIYAVVSKLYLSDSLKLILARPEDYLSVVVRSVLIFARPSSDFPFLAINRARIAAYRDPFNFWIYGVRWPVPAHLPSYWDPLSESLHVLWDEAGIRWMIVALVALGLSAREVGSARLKGAPRVVLGFLVLTCVYVALVGNLFEYAENNRFKFVIEPFLVAAIIFAAQRAFGTLRRPRAIEGRTE